MIETAVFEPGLRVSVVAMSAIKAKFVSYLIGYKPDEYVILEHPLTGGVPIRLEEGTFWAVNFVSRGSIFSFQAQVLYTIRYPIRLVFVGYPASLDRTGLRQNDRYPVRIKADFCREKNQDGPEKKILPGVICDISTGGCLLETPELSPIGTLIRLNMTLPEQGVVENLASEVKTNLTRDDKRFMGLRFTDPAGEGYKKLMAFVNSLGALPIRI